MSKKPIDINKLSQDLSQGSAFFRKSSPPPQSQEPAPQSLTPPESPAPPPEKQGNKLVSQEGRKQASRPTGEGAVQSKKASLIPFTPDPLAGRQMTKKQTFELHKAQLDFMDTAKFELRALGVTKEEMVRTGLELLAKDYYTNQKNSYLYRKFASREVEESQD